MSGSIWSNSFSSRDSYPSTTSRWVWKISKETPAPLWVPVPVLHHWHSTEVFPDVQMESPTHWFVLSASGPGICWSRRSLYWLLSFCKWTDSMCPSLRQPHCSSMIRSVSLHKQAAGKHVNWTPDPKPTANYISLETPEAAVVWGWDGNWAIFHFGGGLDGPQRSLPNSAVLWFCN